MTLQTNMADVSKWKPDDRVVSDYLDVVALKAKEKDMLLTPEALADDLVRPTVLKRDHDQILKYFTLRYLTFESLKTTQGPSLAEF